MNPERDEMPAWLQEARAHLREHYPLDGVAESCLWALHGAGFEMAVTIGDDDTDTTEI